MADVPITIADLIADPEGTLKKMRTQGSIVPIDLGHVVVEHEATRELLLDRRLRPGFIDFLHQFGITSGLFYDWMAMSPLNMEGEDHRRWRALMSKTFTPKSVERLRPFMRRSAEELIRGFYDAGECDFVSAFASKLPSLGLCELIGVPANDRDRFCGWADTIGLGFNPVFMAQRIRDIDAALEQLLDYAAGLVQQRRKDPREDLVTRIALAADEEGGFSEAQITGSVAGLVFAGHETTKNQLGWMVALLAKAPADWDRVHAEPDHARDVVEEVLRFRAAATSIGRTAAEDIEYRGVSIAAGTRVVASIWAANRDPVAFPNPDHFDVAANRGSPQIAFGHGAHHCLGAALARAELQESLIALSALITCPRVLDGATFLPPIGINGPITLPIAFERRAP